MDEKNVGALLVGSDLVHAGDLALSQHKDPHGGKFMPHRIAGFLLSFLDKVQGWKGLEQHDLYIRIWPRLLKPVAHKSEFVMPFTNYSRINWNNI